MAHRTAFAFKHLLAALCQCVRLVRVRRRFKRVYELAQGVQCFVAESMSKPALLLIKEPVLTDRTVVGNADQDRVSSDILRAAVDVSASVSDVMAVLDRKSVV